MAKKAYFILLLLALPIFTAFAQILDPVKWEISLSEIEENGDGTITFKATIDKDWHMYGTDLPADGPKPTTFHFEAQKNIDLVGKAKSTKQPVKKHDPTFDMDINWFEKEVSFVQRIKVSNPQDYNIAGYVDYMVCNDNTCLPPAKEDFHFSKKEESKAVAVKEEIPTKNVTTTPLFKDITSLKSSTQQEETELNKAWEPVIEEMNSFGETENHSKDKSLWSIFLEGIIYGLLAIITPCVWPAIPMTVSYFLHDKDSKKGKASAILYGLSIVVIYETLGLLITALFGASALNELSTNAIFNIVLFAILILFAISFFGGFEIALPASWSTKVDKKVEKTAGIVSIMLMALTLVIVSFSCTGLLIGTLLVHISSSDILAPAVGMLGFAIALAFPFSIFALFPSWLKKLPKKGGWLNSVKVVLGFLELAFALKFFSVADLAYGWGILDREVFLVLWIAIFAFLGLYLLGKIRFEADTPIEHISVLRMLLALVTFAFVVYLVPGLFGAPCKAVSAFAPPIYTQDFNLQDNEVHAQFEDYELGLAYAKQHDKPVVVDFSGYGCVNCRKMEATVWNDPKVSKLLTKDYVLITLYVDNKKKLAKPYTVKENGKDLKITTFGDKWSYLERHKFGANVQPLYTLIDADGNALNKAFSSTEDASEFIEFLEKGLSNYNESKKRD
ncbi:MAG: thioredoxin family protein [Paludibacteraceae bacterium]|nr:thioredoxin family protein [Paludibacteraceae bacterium]